MLNNWIMWVILYLIFATASNQTMTLLAKRKINSSALAVLLELSAGIFILILSPLYEFRFPTDIKIYIFLGLACIFYAISDRMNVTVRSGLDASTVAIIGKTSTFYMTILGFLFFKEKFVLNKFIGALLIIFSNIILFYKKGKFQFNKYSLMGALSKLFYTFALFLDVNISDNFNLPFYVSLTLVIPAIFILVFCRVKPRNIIAEFNNANKVLYGISTVSWGIPVLCALSAYNLGDVSIVAPLLSLTSILNVVVGYFLYKERSNLIQKVIASIIIITSMILMKL